jgi:hypothetical protein
MNKAFVKSTALILLVCFAISLILYGTYVLAQVTISGLLPADNSYSNTSTPTFYFNASSNVSTSINCTLYINDSAYGNSEATNSSLANITANDTLADNFYLWYIDCTDDEGTNSSAPMNITIDTIAPVIGKSFTPGRNWIWVNATASDANLRNLTIFLYNSTGLVNYSTTTDANLTFNFTNLADENYSFNVTAFDYAGNSNTSSSTGTTTIDTVAPAIEFVPPTDSPGTFVNRDFIAVSINATDANQPLQLAIYLYNSTEELINTSSNTTSLGTLTANFTGLAEGLYFFNATAMDGSNLNATELRNVTLDTTAPLTWFWPEQQFNYINESGEIVKYGVENITIYGYVNDTLAGLANWSLDIYVNGDDFNSSACFNATGEAINGTLCTWDTTEFCPIGNECRNVTLVLSVFDRAGNQNNLSDETNRISPIAIDNKYPSINETAIVDFVREGPGRWNATFNVSDEHLNSVSTFVLDSDNNTVVGWGFLCNMNQSNQCNGPESGTFLQEWNINYYTLNNSQVPVYYKFNFNESDNQSWHLATIPGCLKLNSSSNYDCGQAYDFCMNESEESCTKAYRWWLVYNMSHDNTTDTERGALIGLTQENWCLEGIGCSINSSMITSETTFIPQRDKYAGQEEFRTNLTPISLFAAVPELINDMTEGSYNFLVEAHDYVWTSDSLWENLFTVDLTPPEFHFDWWNTTSVDQNMSESPITFPDYRNFTKHADIFFSPNERNILFAVNVTDNSIMDQSYGYGYVIADLSEFDSFPKNGTCNGELPLAYNSSSGKWEGNCTLASFNETDIMDYNNGSNVANFNINFVAVDTYGNSAPIYNATINPPQPCAENYMGPDDNECMPAFTMINLNDFGVPKMRGNNSCVRLGNETTNFNDELDFTNINFILEIQVNLSCWSQGAVNISDFTTMMLWNFTSLDFSSPAIGAKFGNLMDAIQFDITPPNSFGNSWIYVDSEAFRELNTTTTVDFYHLPFTTQPEIIEDVNAAGVNSTNWTTNGYELDFGAITGNLTLVVNGFSGYNISDNVSPIITPVYPLNEQVINSDAINLNFSANGTGKPISRVQMVLAGTNSSYNPLSEPPLDITCEPVEEGSELYYCNESVSLDDGNYQAVITAWDFGGENGNNATYLLNFTIDTITPPVTSVVMKLSNGSVYTNNTRTKLNVSANISATDATNVSGIYYCTSTSNSSCAPNQTYSAQINFTTEATHYLRFTANDTLGNNASIKTYVIIIDRTKPEITDISASGTSSSSSTGTATITITTDEDASCWYKDANFTAANSTTGATLLSGSGTSHTFGIGYSSDGTIGPYYVSCRDTAGNAMTTSNSTGQITVSVTEGSTGGSHTSSGYYGNATINGTLEIIFRETLVTLGKNEYLRFPIKNLWHRCTLISVGNGSVTFSVESTPKQVTVKEGEYALVDVTDDGNADVNITVVKIYSSGATVRFSPVEQPVATTPVTPPIVTPTVPPVTPPAQNASVVKNETTPAPSGRKLPLVWAYVILVAILGIIAFFIYSVMSRKKTEQ